jgi:hypothetical protein
MRLSPLDGIPVLLTIKITERGVVGKLFAILFLSRGKGKILTVVVM